MVDYFNRPYPRWVGYTDILSFESNLSDTMFEHRDIKFYSVAENHLIDMLSLQANSINPVPYFNNDGTLYGDVVGNSPTFYNVNQPDEILSIIETDVEVDNYYAYFLGDWHPDNEHILIRYLSNWRVTENAYSELSLYNVLTETQEILISGNEGISYIDASFNTDGSQILYGINHVEADVSQLMLYDMECREEIALPLFGSSPQWVNGGR